MPSDDCKNFENESHYSVNCCAVCFGRDVWGGGKSAEKLRFIRYRVNLVQRLAEKELDDDLNGQAFPDHIVLNSSRLESPGRELFLYSPAQSSSCRRLPHEDLQQQVTDCSDV